jgi:lipopolysaccharide export LptBFGC system permease protein LptF
VAQLNSIASELSLLDRYLLARIARFALGAWALLALTYLLFFVGDVGARRAGVVGWRLVMNALPFHLPAILAQLAPAALLCGGALAIEGLQRSNELSAMHSCGYSRVALGKPLLLMGIVWSLLGWGLSEWLAPRAEHSANLAYGRAFASPLSGKRQNISGHWVRTSRFQFAKLSAERRLMVRLDRLGHPVELILTNRQTAKSTQQIYDLSAKSARRAVAKAPASRAGAAVAHYEALTRDELARERARQARLGSHDPAASLIFHVRSSYPWLSVSASLVLWILALGENRRLFAQLARALLAAFFFWLLFALFWLLGRSELLSAALSAWLPVALSAMFCAGWLARLLYRATFYR